VRPRFVQAWPGLVAHGRPEADVIPGTMCSADAMGRSTASISFVQTAKDRRIRPDFRRTTLCPRRIGGGRRGGAGGPMFTNRSFGFSCAVEGGPSLLAHVDHQGLRRGQFTGSSGEISRSLDHHIAFIQRGGGALERSAQFLGLTRVHRHKGNADPGAVPAAGLVSAKQRGPPLFFFFSKKKKRRFYFSPTPPAPGFFFFLLFFFGPHPPRARGLQQK